MRNSCLNEIFSIGGHHLVHLNSFRQNALEYAERNPGKFFAAYNGLPFIRLMKPSDSEQERILRLVKNNQEDFLKYRYHNFEVIINMGPAGLEVALEVALDNLERLTCDNLNLFLYQKNISVNQRIAAALAQPQAAQKLDSLINTAWKDSRVRVLLFLGQLNSVLEQKLIKLAAARFKDVIASDSFYLLAELLKKKSQASIELFDQTLNNLPLLLIDKDGQKFVEELKTLNSEFSQRLDKKINKLLQEGFYEEPSLSQLHGLNQFLPCRQELLEKINAALLSDDATFEDVLKKIIYLEPCIEERELNPLTITESHLLHNLKSVLGSGVMRDYKHAPELVKMDLKLHNKIRELEESGYAAFVHGQRIGNLLIESWFTKLQALKQQKPTTDFLYAHVKKLDANKQDEQKLRQELLKNGRGTEYERSRLLFLNGPLFGNSTNLGSSTRYYTLQNSNVGPRYVNLKDAFESCLYERIYAKYEDELKELEEEFSRVSRYGNTLLVAVPKDQLSRCVFSARSGGYKKEIYIEGIGKTSDIRVIMHTLEHEPHKIKNSDQIEFCLVMTQDENGGLNPASGIKVYSYIAPKDDKTYAEFKNKENRLWQKIADEINNSK